MGQARILDGKALAEQIRGEVADGVRKLKEGGARIPGLGVVLVGDNPASRAYVTMKGKACQAAGFHSVQMDLPEQTTQEELLAKVRELNADEAIHGVLVQLPLPPQIDEMAVVRSILPEKDVDGLHPVNAGNLVIGLPGFAPCTPLGVCELLTRTGIETKGCFTVIIGRSNLVGKPLALLLSRKGKGADATVCMCHSRTQDLADIARRADILIAAMGRAHFVTADMIKPGATVIDVGINRVEDPSAKRGYRLVGDVDYEAAVQVAGAITPVPGGVGPLTIAMLLRNTLESARAAAGLPSAVTHNGG